MRADGWTTGEKCGDPYPLCTSPPSEFLEGEEVRNIVVASWGACAIRMRGDVVCWGDGDYAGTGDAPPCDGSSGATCSPPHRLTIEVPVAELSLSHTSCALARNGDPYCWGNIDSITGGRCGAHCTPVRVAAIREAQQVVGGESFICARFTDGSVHCLGDNRDGQLGDATTLPRTTPAVVTGLPPIVEIRGNGTTVCGRTADDAVWCWGNNDYGVVIGASANATNIPVRVLAPGLSP